MLATVSLLAIVPLVQASTTTSSAGSTSGYVTYAVQTTYNGTSTAATVRETVSPSTSSESIVTLAVQGTEGNFTYSHEVNSSLALLPYLPSISSTSYTYSGKGYTVTASISQDGTSTASFGGKSYTLTDYRYSATITSTNGTSSITGTIAAFPSDLVYSVTAQSQQGSATATLTATSLSPSAAAAAPAAQAASAGLGLTVAAGALVVSLGVKSRNKAKAEGPKPDHWVD